MTIHYQSGGTLSPDSELYISREADGELLTLCQEGQFTYILAPRQIGKSSLMLRTAQKLTSEGVSVVKLDLTRIGTQVEAEGWYYGLLYEVRKQLELKLNLPEWWAENKELSLAQRLTLFFEEVLLSEVTSSVVIFVDEIDTTLSLTFTDDFFACIRALYVARASKSELKRLSFVLIGVATPGDLIRDPKRTPFNIGQRVEMTDFTFDEALPLAGGLGLPEDKARETLKNIMEWSGGHPYLTQRLCQLVKEEVGKNGAEPLEVSELVAHSFFGEKSEEDNNLQFVRDMLTRRAPDLLQVLTTYREVRREREVLDQEQSIVKSHLKLSGVVKRERGKLLVRNRIYRTVFDEKWIKEHLPINWGRRLRQAAGLIAVTTLLAVVMGGLAIYAFIQQGEATRQTDEARLQRNSAENAQKQSDRLRQSAEAQSLAFRAQTQTDPELALLLTIEAAQRIQDGKLDDTGGQVEAALRQAVANYTPNIALRSPATITNSATFSPDGKRLLFAGNDGFARVHEVGTNKEIMSLGGYTSAVNIAVYNPDGTQIATGDSSGNIILYEASSGKPLRIMSACQCSVTYLAFSPDGKLLAESLEERFMHVVDPFSGQELWSQFNDAGGFKSLIFSPDGKWLAGVGGTKLYLWDLTSRATPPVEPTILPSPFNGSDGLTTAFSLDSRWLAIASADSTTGVWDIVSGKFVALLTQGGVVNSVIFSKDGKLVFTAGNDNLVKVWETESGKELTTLRGHTAAVTDVILSPDGKLAVTSSADSTIRVWDYISGKEVAVLRGHAGSVAWGVNHSGLSFSPDGRWLASTGNDGTARLWDWQSISQKRLVLSGYSNQLKGASYSPDGKGILIIADNEKPGIVDSNTGKQILTLEGQLFHMAFITSQFPGAFSPDGKLVVTSTGTFDRTTRIWNAISGKVLANLNLDTYLDYSLTKDLTLFSIARNDFTIMIRSFVTDALVVDSLKGHQGEITEMAFSPDNKYLASASLDETTRIWNISSGKEVAVLRGHSGAVLAVDYSQDGKYIVTAGADNTIRLWDSSSWQEARVFLGHTGAVNSVVFSPDGKTIISGSSDNTARIWDITSGKELLTLQGHTGAVMSVSVSNDDKLVATASMDGTARIWQANTGKELLVLKGHNGPVTAVIFKPDGRRVYTGGTDKTVRVWDSSNGQEIKVTTGFTRTIKRIGTSALYVETIVKGAPAKVPKAEDPAWVVSDDIWRGMDLYYGLGYGWFGFVPQLLGGAFSPDSKLIATGGNDGMVRLWDSSTGKLVRTLEGHQADTEVSGNDSFSPDGARLVAGSYAEKTAIIWEVSSGKKLITLTGHTDAAIHAAFSPDGTLVVTSSADNTARIWEAGSGKQLQILKGHTGAVYTARFSPDGKFIVTASLDGTTRIWDTVSGQQLEVLRGHSGSVRDASFSPDGKNILSASEDSTAIIQPCEICGSFAQTLEQAKKTVTRSLTFEEKTQFGLLNR